MKKSLALGALMAFLITGNAMAAETYSFSGQHFDLDSFANDKQSMTINTSGSDQSYGHYGVYLKSDVNGVGSLVIDSEVGGVAARGNYDINAETISIKNGQYSSIYTGECYDVELHAKEIYLEGPEVLVSNGNLKVEAENKMELKGIIASWKNIDVTFNGSESSFVGEARLRSVGEIDLTFNDGAKWDVTGDSNVTSISGNSYEVKGTGVESLTVANNKNTGDGASYNGIYSTGSTTISGLKALNVTSANRHAIEVGTKMNIEAEGVKLTSNNGNGILAYGDLTVKAKDMGILAQDGHGIRAAADDNHAANVNIDVERMTIVAENHAETAIKASDGASVKVNASDTANINGQVLALQESSVTLTGGTVNVTSVEDALDAVGGTIVVDAKNVNLVSTDSDGIQAYDTTISVNGDDVTVKGKSFGIKSVAENTSNVKVTGGNITIEGVEGAIGAFESAVDNEGNEAFTGKPVVSVNATGNVDIKGEVYGEHNSEISLKGATVNVAGGAKDALESCGGTISVDATNINITSDTNDGIQAEDAIVTLEAKENVIIDAGQWAIKNIENTNSIVEINATNINITGGKEVQDGGAIWAFQVDDSDGQGKVIVNGSGTTTIDGDIKAEGNSEVSVLLNNEKSSLTGSVATANGATTALTMNDGATWNVTGVSNVSVVAGNKGTIDVTAVANAPRVYAANGTGAYVTIGENQNADLTVTKEAQGYEVATKENLTALQNTVKVEKGNEISAATLTNAAIAGDVTMDADGNVTTTLDTDLNVTGDVVAGDVSLQGTAQEVERVEEKFDGQVGRLDNRIDKVEDRVDKVGAMAAAMASLRTMGYDPEAPTEIAVGVGQYRSETGLAIGAFHYPNKNFMLNFSLSTAGDEVMGGIGATWKIGRKR